MTTDPATPVSHEWRFGELPPDLRDAIQRQETLLTDINENLQDIAGRLFDVVEMLHELKR